MMTRLSKVLFSLFILFAFLGISNPVFAGEWGEEMEDLDPIDCTVENTAHDIRCFISLLFNLFLPLAIGAIGIPLIIINGYKIMTSQGDPDKLKAGKEGLTAALIGVTFVAASLTILNIILKTYGLGT